MKIIRIFQYPNESSKIINNVLKLGVQAPSGTIFKINNEEIMVGRTGIYECSFEEDNLGTIEIGESQYTIIVDIVQSIV